MGRRSVVPDIADELDQSCRVVVLAVAMIVSVLIYRFSPSLKSP
jgi:hypothetical protein